MTHEEAWAVAGVLVTADGGCGDCAHKLADQMAARFPEFDWNDLVARAIDMQPYPWEPAPL